MPVITTSEQLVTYPVRRINVQRELRRDRSVAPSELLDNLRRASNRLSYRLVDFVDEACLSDGEGGLSEGGPSEEPAGLSCEPEEFDALESLLQNTAPGPQSCSYLSAGQSFSGIQRLSTSTSSTRPEDWRLVVRIQGIDLSKGYVCGVMEATNIPQAASTVVTFWEGEVVDNMHHTFFTQKWGATRDIDLKHWRKFQEGFSEMNSEVVRCAGRSTQLSTSPFVFMRWKEILFASHESFGLTIAGFYYVCLDRRSGSISGYYFDPNSAPFQYISLEPVTSPNGGMSFGAYALC
ncbi:hypothetical protein CEUSTIGMA_g6565.t1 [Chlamydomonas eustigma]|uniref:Glucose-induced degradation protein 4 homolog n=1 Tax=Chlamydomonas eustigma TaxID=1157962 RepID=A0A250X7T5_9CHLO|nr:hypothetical protein CEUSTIGMA_g6565.t1 [Chlamydomonas eustigma]|eukprot:GAX79125.1 hypothetical protein CEUSTIGMA_g6565.t1 [Chlamydomonas eustigma]